MQYRPTYEKRIGTPCRLGIGAAAGMSLIYTGVANNMAPHIAAEAITVIAPVSTYNDLAYLAFGKEITVPRSVSRFIRERASDLQYFNWLGQEMLRDSRQSAITKVGKHSRQVSRGTARGARAIASLAH